MSLTQDKETPSLLINAPGIYRHVLLLIIYAVLCAACTKSPSMPLSVGANNWIGYQPLYISRELGYLDNKSIKLVELNSSTDIMQELRAGQLHAAALTMDETLTMLEEGLDLQVIMVIDISAGGDALVAKPGYEQIKDLTGKSIAVEYTAVGAVLLEAALNSANMALADIETVPCEFYQHIDCYSSADAVVTFEPNKTKLVERGGIVLFDSSSIIGRIIDVLVVRTEVMQIYAPVIEELVDGYFEGLQAFTLNTPQVYPILQDRTGLTKEELELSYKGILMPARSRNIELFKSNELQEQTLSLLDIMLERELLKKPVDITTLFNSDYVAG